MKKTILALTILICTFLQATAFAQWDPIVRLSDNAALSYTTEGVNCIASSGPSTHVIWQDERGGNWEIYYRRSTNGGTAWEVERRFTNNSGASYDPSICVSGSNVHVVWYDNHQGVPDIYYRRSTDGGANFQPEVRISNNAEDSYRPTITTSGSYVHVTWTDERDGNEEIYYKRSTDNGATWGAETRLTNNSAVSIENSVSASGSSVYVVWRDARDGNFEIYFKQSSDNGATWGSDTRLTNNPSHSTYPSISVSGVNVHIVWREFRDGNDEIYYKNSLNGGTNWGTDTRLTNNASQSYSPVINAQSSLLHVVWTDNREGNWEIYYKRSTNNGSSWGSDERLTNHVASSGSPSTSASGTALHVVFVDGIYGNEEIVYLRNPTGNFVGIEHISSEIPNGFSIEQNYPNPFNPTTNINFSIPKSAYVKLVVYDMMGRVAAELVNGNYSAGTYKVDFEASKLSSGTYFYKITAGEFTSVKKMTLVK
ncbi:MAG: T9SS type A sorting domain-containing protein [Ignavibacteria bacterium]|nr:T9SS type A sorting domain-containing protein [Ignavibacteria bacterium]